SLTLMTLSPRGEPPPAADAGSTDGGGAPERPRATVDIAHVDQKGRTLRIPAGGDLQAALETANPGDRIELEPGASYRGPFRLPRKEGSGWIVVSTSASNSNLRPGRRVSPSDAPHMAKLVSSSSRGVIATEPAAHHYRLVGLEIAPAGGVF